MDLIEKLGGYEKAKLIVDKSPCNTYTYYNHPHQKGYIRCWGGDDKEHFIVSDIKISLLQYRREHNIFEVGDLVVNDGLIAPHIYSFKKLMPDISMALIMRNDEEGACGLFRLRHATPEEIQAGRRLEVCGG